MSIYWATLVLINGMVAGASFTRRDNFGFFPLALALAIIIVGLIHSEGKFF